MSSTVYFQFLPPIFVLLLCCFILRVLYTHTTVKLFLLQQIISLSRENKIFLFLPSLLQFLALLISLGRSKFLSDIILFLSEEISLIFLGVQDCFIIHSLSFCLLEKVFIYISFSKDISDSFFFFFQYIKDITLLCSDWHSF